MYGDLFGLEMLNQNYLSCQFSKKKLLTDFLKSKKFEAKTKKIENFKAKTDFSNFLSCFKDFKVIFLVKLLK